MTVDYDLLGKSKAIRDRRYKVLSLMVKGGTPDDITRTLGLSFQTVHNDMAHIRKQPLHTLSATIAKDLNNSAYELKIRELEVMAESVKHDIKAWTALQKPILEARAASLKLQGLMSEKVEHTGSVDLNENKTIDVNIDEKLAKEFGDWLAGRKTTDKKT